MHQHPRQSNFPSKQERQIQQVCKISLVVSSSLPNQFHTVLSLCKCWNSGSKSKMRSVSASFRGTLMLNCFYGLPRAGSQLPSASICAVRSDSVHQSFLFRGSDGLGWPQKGSKMAQFGSKTMASRWSRCLGTPHECPETGPRSLYTRAFA